MRSLRRWVSFIAYSLLLLLLGSVGTLWFLAIQEQITEIKMMQAGMQSLAETLKGATRHG